MFQNEWTRDVFQRKRSKSVTKKNLLILSILFYFNLMCRCKHFNPEDVRRQSVLKQNQVPSSQNVRNEDDDRFISTLTPTLQKKNCYFLDLTLLSSTKNDSSTPCQQHINIVDIKKFSFNHFLCFFLLLSCRAWFSFSLTRSLFLWKFPQQMCNVGIFLRLSFENLKIASTRWRHGEREWVGDFQWAVTQFHDIS